MSQPEPCQWMYITRVNGRRRNQRFPWILLILCRPMTVNSLPPEGVHKNKTVNSHATYSPCKRLNIWTHVSLVTLSVVDMRYTNDHSYFFFLHTFPDARLQTGKFLLQSDRHFEIHLWRYFAIIISNVLKRITGHVYYNHSEPWPFVHLQLAACEFWVR